jgi:hypothetical protein
MVAILFVFERLTAGITVEGNLIHDIDQNFIQLLFLVNLRLTTLALFLLHSLRTYTFTAKHVSTILILTLNRIIYHIRASFADKLLHHFSLTLVLTQWRMSFV